MITIALIRCSPASLASVVLKIYMQYNNNIVIVDVELQSGIGSLELAAYKS